MQVWEGRGREAPPTESGRGGLPRCDVILNARLEGITPEESVFGESGVLRGVSCTRALNVSGNGHQGKHPVQSATLNPQVRIDCRGRVYILIVTPSQ